MKGIVLKKVVYQESDLIVKALLSTGHKVSFFAKSALKSKKRFGGGLLDPLNFLEFQTQINQKDKELIFLNEAQMVYDFPLLKTDYERIKVALYFLKILNKVEMSGIDDESKVFDLLLHALKSLETCRNINILKSQFELKFLYLHGVLDIKPTLEPLVKSSLYKCDEIYLSSAIESVLRQSSFEIENFVESSLL